MEREELALVLSSILHDVGKVSQRDVVSVRHAVLSGRFVSELANIPEETRSLTSKLVKYHHTDERNISDLNEREMTLLNILKAADRLSASHDREDLDPGEFREDPRMQNIFRHITFSRDSKPLGPNDPFPLMTVESLIKSQIGDGGKLQVNDMSYRKIYNDLLKECGTLSLDFLPGFFNSLDSVLMNYLTFVPSAFYYSKPNITLYDHLRLTASISSTLYRSGTAKPEDAKAIFVMGNVSGIQDYIFKYMVSEGVDDRATKRLRGRSFFIRLLTDSVVSYILKEFDLYRFNVIWEKTDGFLIMLNYSQENIKKLEEIRRNVEHFLLNSWIGPMMYMDWGYMSVNALEDNGREDFSKEIRNILNRIQRRKKGILNEVMGKSWDIISKNDQGEESSHGICRYCGLHLTNGERCSQCSKEEEIGRNLASEGTTIYSSQGASGVLDFVYGDFRISYSFEQKQPTDEKININSFDHGVERINARTILQGNYSPRDENGVISINKLLCGKEEGKKEGIKRCLYLGIVKADVDNMGWIMSYGIHPQTLSRYASISWLITVFFSAITNIVAERNDMYIIYAGGDDLSSMGPADRAVEFIKELRDSFSKWVKNDSVTFSAGFKAMDSGFPVRKGIVLADKSLERAKKTIIIERNIRKDSLGIFDLVIPWKCFPEPLRKGKEVYELVKNEKDSGPRIGRNFPMVLLNLDRDNPYVSPPKKGERIRIPDAYLTYYLRRNMKGTDVARIDQTVGELTGKLVFQYIRFVAYYALIKIRRDEYEREQL